MAKSKLTDGQIRSAIISGLNRRGSSITAADIQSFRDAMRLNTVPEDRVFHVLKSMKLNGVVRVEKVGPRTQVHRMTEVRLLAA